MSDLEQFESAVTQAGAKAIRIVKRGLKGAERLIIQTQGGLITREVPLRGNLDQDIQDAMKSAKEIVASEKSLTAGVARSLSFSQNVNASSRRRSLA